MRFIPSVVCASRHLRETAGVSVLLGPKDFLPYFEWRTGITLRRGKFAKWIDEWIVSGGDVPSPFDRGDFDAAVDTVQDARAICRALASDRAFETDVMDTPAHSNLVGFLQRPGNGISAAIFVSDGLPSVRRIFHKEFSEIAASDDDRGEYDARRNATMLLLKVLALYGLREDTALIISTAAHPAFQEEYLWSVIFGSIGEEHPEAAEICNALRDGIPVGFAGVAYLDFANGLSLHGRISDHPFDTDEGIERLTGYLMDTDPEHDSYAKSAVTALPFLRESARAQLLALANDHNAVAVRSKPRGRRPSLGRKMGGTG